MSLSTVVILNAALVIALFGVLAYVLRIPFRLERVESDELAA